tara:strand:- start:236450 stop:237004 length:555 start_codon:yes stop_codon:yes gene_type:complete
VKTLFTFNILKSAVATFLFVAFLFNFGGCYIILKYQQYQVKKEMIQQIKAGVSDADLTQIRITSKNENELLWEDGEEFRYKGIMYDVVKTETLDKETTIYHCLTDTQETNLLAELQDILKKNKKSKNNRKNPVKTFFKFFNKIPPQPQKQGIAVFETKTEVSFEYINYYNPPKLDVSSPPPKTV